VTEDWAAVATAINQRMAELGLRQSELIERSRLSKTAVSEIRHNIAQRRRSARTLEALSVELGWHPQHVIAVLKGRKPPQVGEPVVLSDDDVPGRLAAIEHHLRKIADQLDHIDSIKDQLDQISADLSVVMDRNGQPKP
jgi:transcriptional regulator with XRE-family HTH domain